MPTQKIAVLALFAFLVLSQLPISSTAGADEPLAPKKRRILYNCDGCSVFMYKKGVYEATEMTIDDLRNVVDELTFPESQVDTFLMCLNAQVTFYPSKVGSMIGARNTPEQRKTWPKEHILWIETLKKMYAAGVDPYAEMLAEAKRRGREALITIRMNDTHQGDETSFLRSQFWVDHPEMRLRENALDFSHQAVRDHTFEIVREACQRYDCDGLEMDFVRHPYYFFRLSKVDKVPLINELVERIRKMSDELGRKRGKKLVVAARVPTSYEACLKMGCDPVIWAQKGWIDFLTVSEEFSVRLDVPLRPWKEKISSIPIYGSIEQVHADTGAFVTASEYRRAARHLWNEGADGMYLFNFIMSREHHGRSKEPPFEVLTEIGDPATLERALKATEKR